VFNFEKAVTAAASLMDSIVVIAGGMYGKAGEFDAGWVETRHGSN
jgi:hypothetical protein